MSNKFSHPLMSSNIDRPMIDDLIKFLQQEPIPQLTNGSKVREFEEKWNAWVGTKHCVMTSSGAMANELTFLALKNMFPLGSEILLSPLNWASDVYSVIRNGFKPVFCDIQLANLSFNLQELRKKITPKTKAILVTCVLGINPVSLDLLKICEEFNLLLIEDNCEGHGTTFLGKKVGGFGVISNFSFYFAHHISTICGGAIHTNNEKLYQVFRCLRSHSMLREATCPNFKEEIASQYPDLNQDFIFIAPGFNARPTEISGVLGLSGLPYLDSNNSKRKEMFKYFIERLDGDKYFKNFVMEGQCAYSFIVILKTPNPEKWKLVEEALRSNLIEFRRGLSGGGNQTLQPYYKQYLKENNLTIDQSEFPVMNHIHANSCYIGLYPTLEKSKIDNLLRILNSLDL